MPIFTFEKHQSSKRLAGKVAMVDTSYMISLSDVSDRRNGIIASFHRNATEQGATFAINTVVRQEFLKDVRKKALIDAILSLVASDPQLHDRYKKVLGQEKNLTETSLNHGYQRIYKDHVKQGDESIFATILETNGTNIWEIVSEFETAAKLVYTRSAPGTDADSLWESLGDLMAIVCMDSTDAMIANLASNIGADAIVTTDCDFACLHSLLDIFVPKEIADQCRLYSEAVDEDSTTV